MSAKLPSSNKEYKDPRYWNERFQQEDYYEWLVDYKEIKPALLRILQNFNENAKFLQLGCGNSNFGIDLYREGFKDITNIDISEVCVEKMSNKYPQLQFQVMDMTKMEFSDDTFDVVIEKASLDSLLVDSKSPWDCTSPGCLAVSKSLLEVKRVLKPHGVFVSITFSQPHFRVPLLAHKELGWSIEVEKFSTSEGLLDYFLVVCQSGDPEGAVSRWCVPLPQDSPSQESHSNSSEADNEEFLLRVETSCFLTDTDTDNSFSVPALPGMKRRGEFMEENSMENKRYRGAAAGEVECRLLIPSKMGGAVIGKKGSNIQKLRSEFSANIRIPDAPGPERIMGITSEELITCCQVVEASLPFMFEDEDENRDREIRVLFHQSVVGGIIGKGGSKIQEIREASGANVKAFQNCAPSSSDRVVAIKGPSSSLVRALEMCLEVAQENSDRSGRGVAYDPANFDAYYSDEYGGYGTADRYSGAARRGGPMMGRGGGGGYGRGFGGYGSEEGPYHTGFGFARGGGGGGSRGGYGNPRGGFNAGPDQFGRGGGGGPMMGFGGFGAGRQADRFGDDDFSGGFGGNFGGDEGEMKTSQSTIPKNMAGAILGPGGQRIRRIRAESRANITLGEANENDERVITIEGTDKQIEQANYLLRQAVRDHHSGGGGGRGGY